MKTTHEPRTLIGFSRRSDSARQIADLLRSDIVNRYFDGSLPYEWKLVEMYRTTRNVLRDAMTILQGQNLLRRVPGSGTFTLAPGTSFSVDRKDARVAVRQEAASTPSSVPSVAETRIAGYPDGHYQCLNARVDGCPETVADRLEIDPGAPTLFTEVAISINNERQRLRSSWIPLERVPGIENEVLDCFVTDLIARITLQDTHCRHLLIEAVDADPSSSQILGIPGGALLMTERLNCLDTGEPIEFGFSRHRGDRTFIVSNL